MKRQTHNEDKNFVGWQESWKRGWTPWEQPGADSAFLEYLKAELRAELPKNAAALVPLCGGSGVLKSLRNEGLAVTGVELVPKALRELRRRHFPRATWRRRKEGAAVLHQIRGVTLAQQDFLNFSAPATFDLVYDRAAMIAMHPRQRRRYASVIKKSLKPGGYLYLISFTCTGKLPLGPPFPISGADLKTLYKGLRLRRKKSVTVRDLDSRFTEQGVKSFTYSSYLFQKP